MLTAYPVLAAGAWLQDLGFRRRRPNLWSLDGLRLSADGGWLSLRSAVPRTGEAREPPGPWKMRRCAGRRQLGFDAPLAAIAAIADRAGTIGDGDPAPPDLARVLLQWAMDTRAGRAPGPWQPPEAQRLQEIVPEAALTFRAGTLLQPARLDHGDGALALRVPLCQVQGDLSAARRRWLERFLLDAESLRMVRVGLLESQEHAAVEAAVELSGAPLNILEGLLTVALDVLRHAFVLLAPTATVIADARWRSELLERNEPGSLNERRSSS